MKFNDDSFQLTQGLVEGKNKVITNNPTYITSI